MAAREDEAGADEDGIADLFGDGASFGNVAAMRCGLFEFEPLISRGFLAITAASIESTEVPRMGTPASQAAGEVQRRLATNWTITPLTRPSFSENGLR